MHIEYSTYKVSEESNGGGIHPPPWYRKKRGPERVNSNMTLMTWRNVKNLLHAFPIIIIYNQYVLAGWTPKLWCRDCGLWLFYTHSLWRDWMGYGSNYLGSSPPPIFIILYLIDIYHIERFLWILLLKYNIILMHLHKYLFFLFIFTNYNLLLKIMRMIPKLHLSPNIYIYMYIYIYI